MATENNKPPRIYAVKSRDKVVRAIEYIRHYHEKAYGVVLKNEQILELALNECAQKRGLRIESEGE